MLKKLEYFPGLSKTRYGKLVTDRSGFETIARDCAKYSIPFLFPEQGTSRGSEVKVPQNSLGANGVKTLAAKLLLTLFPPNSPFFRLMVSSEFRGEYNSSTDSDQKTKDELALSEIERVIVEAVEGANDRAKKHHALQLLLVTGNALCYMPDDSPMRVFRLDQYVVKRDPMGQVVEIVVKELVDPNHAGDAIFAIYNSNKETGTGDDSGDVKPIELYTHLRLFGTGKSKRWGVHQEVLDVKVDGSEGTYPFTACPFIALRALSMDGEDYGRPYVYEFLGDLKTIDELTDAKISMAIQAAKVIYEIKPESVARPSDYAKAKTGEFVYANPGDAVPLQLQKLNDLSIVSNIEAAAMQRIQQNFLMAASVQRDAERVTKAEIRVMAKELEDNLGAFYTVLAQDFQMPYIQRKIFTLEKAKKIPKFPAGVVEPSIITGLEALGRGHDLNKYNDYIQGLALMNAIPKEMLVKLNIDEFANRLALACGVDTKGLVKTPEQQQQELAQSAQQQMAQSVAPEGVRQLGAMVNNSMKGQ